MRLDKYLKVSRLIKRRTVANDACDGERVSVNGKAAKASYDVKLGDLITVTFGTKSVTVKVLQIKDTTKKSEADGMYEIVSESDA
jgi:ribosomal 50S subunit-recycling heat shock protein